MEYAVRMGAPSAAHFDMAEEPLRIATTTGQAVFSTEWTQGATGGMYPQTIHASIRGEGADLLEAQRKLGDTLAVVFPAIAVASNAAIGDPWMIAAYGLDLATPQPYIGYETPSPDQWFPMTDRIVPVEDTFALIEALFSSANPERLATAFDLYRQALLHFGPQRALMAGEFLYITAEKLARTLIDNDAAQQGMSRKNVRRRDKNSKGRDQLKQYLETKVFAGDTKAFRAMAEASNGFEHGYKDIDVIRRGFVGVLTRAFGHLRSALITATGVDSQVAARLLDERYSEIRSHEPTMLVANATVQRRDPNLPVPEMDNVAPVELAWEKEISGNWQPDGRILIDVNSKAAVTKRPENVAVNIEAVELFATNVVQVQKAAPTDKSDQTPDTDANE